MLPWGVLNSFDRGLKRSAGAAAPGGSVAHRGLSGKIQYANLAKNQPRRYRFPSTDLEIQFNPSHPFIRTNRHDFGPQPQSESRGNPIA